MLHSPSSTAEILPDQRSPCSKLGFTWNSSIFNTYDRVKYGYLERSITGLHDIVVKSNSPFTTRAGSRRRSGHTLLALGSRDNCDWKFSCGVLLSSAIS